MRPASISWLRSLGFWKTYGHGYWNAGTRWYLTDDYGNLIQQNFVAHFIWYSVEFH